MTKRSHQHSWDRLCWGHKRQRSCFWCDSRAVFCVIGGTFFAPKSGPDKVLILLLHLRRNIGCIGRIRVDRNLLIYMKKVPPIHGFAWFVSLMLVDIIHISRKRVHNWFPVQIDRRNLTVAGISPEHRRTPLKKFVRVTATAKVIHVALEHVSTYVSFSTITKILSIATEFPNFNGIILINIK